MKPWIAFFQRPTPDELSAENKENWGKAVQSDSAVIEPTTGDKKIVHELLGGLSIAPYGIYPLLSAYAFAQGWINWETNNGPPFLGAVLAWFIARLIRRFYRKKYNFDFEIDRPQNNQRGIKGVMVVAAVLGTFVMWYLDANLHAPIRFMPLWFGLFVGLRGIDWLQKGWTAAGLFHIVLGVIPIGMGVAPLVLGISPENQYFGFEGIYELSVMGVVIIAISVMEHRIFRNVRASDLE